jgi:hypothetical protein
MSSLPCGPRVARLAVINKATADVLATGSAALRTHTLVAELVILGTTRDPGPPVKLVAANVLDVFVVHANVL